MADMAGAGASLVIEEHEIEIGESPTLQCALEMVAEVRSSKNAMRLLDFSAKLHRIDTTTLFRYSPLALDMRKCCSKHQMHL